MTPPACRSGMVFNRIIIITTERVITGVIILFYLIDKKNAIYLYFYVPTLTLDI